MTHLKVIGMFVSLYKISNILQGQGKFIQFLVICTTKDNYYIFMG